MEECTDVCKSKVITFFAVLPLSDKPQLGYADEISKRPQKPNRSQDLTNESNMIYKFTSTKHPTCCRKCFVKWKKKLCSQFLN